jgi:hypothetical protein
MEDPARAPHRHLSIPRGLHRLRAVGRPLDRNARRLAVGIAMAAGIGWGFVPTVIRLYGSGGSLADAVVPWMVAAASVVANAVVLAFAALALRGVREDGPGTS